MARCLVSYTFLENVCSACGNDKPFCKKLSMNLAQAKKSQFESFSYFAILLLKGR